MISVITTVTQIRVQLQIPITYHQNTLELKPNYFVPLIKLFVFFLHLGIWLAIFSILYCLHVNPEVVGSNPALGKTNFVQPQLLFVVVQHGQYSSKHSILK